MSKTTDVANFSTNLKFLCGFYSSISEVCRRIEINRQQFNRYLGGSNFPSYKNLKKICDFFGVEIEEIIDNPTLFKSKVSPPSRLRPEHAIPENMAKIIMPLLTGSKEGMERYEGYYYRYFYSFGFPGFIFRSFMKIYKSNDIYYMKHIERTSGTNPLLGARLTIKYHGLVFLLADRLFIVESEPELNSTISETILTPSYRPNNPYMSGLMVCASSCGAHQPGSARTVFEYLGKNINVRDAMRKCDLFHHTDERVPKSIKQAITNVITQEEFTLHPPRN
jgi:transcriptional regulator with XRE-family HTH domain